MGSSTEKDRHNSLPLQTPRQTHSNKKQICYCHMLDQDNQGFVRFYNVTPKGPHLYKCVFNHTGDVYEGFVSQENMSFCWAVDAIKRKVIVFHFLSGYQNDAAMDQRKNW